ncbi:MAG TPA: hypothetical protein VJJ79_01930 [Candidatus Nanoarchaeia archaeon]|nr:hypothetical protein [Candidatus Nanoarchaeia archaeon]
MDNRAQFSMPFTTLFAILVGAILLLFFIGFAYKYISFSGALTSAETVQALNDEFAAFAVSDAAEKTMDFQQDFDFQYRGGSIYSGGQSQSVDQVLFAPAEIQGDVLFLATRAVELPYRVANAFYLVDGRTMYLFISDEASKSAVDSIVSSYTAFPQTFPHASYTLEQITDSLALLEETTAMYDSVRFLFFADPSNTLLADIEETFSNAEVLYVESTVEDYTYGDVTFPNGKKAFYLGYPLLLGAMISADASGYEQSIDTVLERLAVVTGVYYDKARFISARLPACDYGAIKGYLSSYRSFVNKEATYSQFQGYVERVDETNKDLGGDCPVLF